MKKLLAFSLLVITFVSGCTSGTKAVMISLSSTTATVQAGGTMQFTATVANDSASKGVTWSVTCSAAQCGSVSPTTTPSGTPTTYTAPSAPPASNLTVTITVTSVTDSTKKGTITITIPAIAVVVAPATGTILAGATGQFTATVSNDPATKGVTWSVSCSVAPCGSVAPTTTPSGSPTTYTAPSTPPASNLTVTITGTSISDTTKTNSAMITVPAVTISVAPPTPMVLVGSTQAFTATVANTSNMAVTWKLTQGGAACTAACGMLSSASTNPVTYTPPAPASDLTIMITATSAADTMKSASTTVTVPAITVSVAPPNAPVAVSGFTAFTATVGHDGANKGVTWTLSQGGTACAPATCGTINPGPTASGAGTTYAAPAGMPANPIVTVTATSVTDPTKSASATVTITPVSVSVSPATVSVAVNGTQQFTATVTFDAHNLGVSWTITTGGAPCPLGCGSVSPSSSLSGVAVTYTAPSSVPGGPVTLTATSTTDATKSASATITVTAGPPISVAITQQPPASLVVSSTANVTATVTNDGGNKGVDWTVTCGSAGACGSFNPTHTASGSQTVYTAPASVPTGNTVTITATSTADNTKSAKATITITSLSACGTGNESVLNGQYALLVQGFVGIGATSPFVGAASIAADGKGNITSGEADINEAAGGPAHLTVTAAGSVYTVGSDDRGCLTLNFGASNTVTFHFAVGGISAGVASRGRLIEFNDTTGNGTRNAGILRQQTQTDFANSKLQPRYAFGLDGFDLTGGHFALAGSFSIGGGGTTITNGFDDADDAGTVFSGSNGSGTIGAISATSGRAMATFMTPGSVTNHSAFYVVNASEFFAVSADTLTANTPITSGRGIVTGSSFSNSSLNGNYIIHISGAHANGTGDVTIGLLTLSGGTLSGTLYENNAGVSGTMTPSGTYSVDATSGRVTITAAGGHSPVFYLTTLTDGISGFFVGTDSTATFGLAEFQPAATYTTSSLAGQYFVGNEDPASNTITNSVATATVTAAGTTTATSDKSGPFSPFLTTGQVMMFTLAITNPNGTGNFGPNTVFITNGTRSFFMDQASTSNPSITVVEK